MWSSIRTGVIASVVVVMLLGCANTPEVQVSYYLPKSALKLELIRTLACNDDNRLSFVSNVIPTDIHFSDRDARHTISLRDLDGVLSHSNSVFEFHDDGRLKAINAKSTGQGGAIVTSGLGLISNTSSLVGEPPEREPVVNGEPDPQKKACDYIGKWGTGEPKVMTLKFEGTVEPVKNSGEEICSLNSSLQPTLDTLVHADQLKFILGPVQRNRRK